MLKDITKLTISGKCYSPGADLELFKKRINIVYGRNGSGKSTIANSIRGLITDTPIEGITAQFNATLDSAEKQRIFVYDEKFIDDKIKISHDGYDTIVMFGQQNEVQEKIDECIRNIETTQSLYDACIEELTTLSSDKNSNSPNYWRKELENALRKKGNFWAERYRKIRDTRTNGPVSDTFISNLLNDFFLFSTHDTITDEINLTNESKNMFGTISARIQQDIEDFLKAKTHGAIKQTINTSLTSPNWDKISQNLAEIVNEPTLSNRDKVILEKIKEKVLPDYLSASSAFFSKNENVCPFCMRAMNELDIQELKNTLSNILNEDVVSFKENINQHIAEINRDLKHIRSLADLSIIFPQAPILKEIEQYKNRERKIVSTLESLLKTLEIKKEHPYQEAPVDIVEKAKSDFKNYSDSISEINEAIARHNTKCSQLNKIENDLLQDNKNLAVYENYTVIKNYLLKAKYVDELKDKAANLNKQLIDLRETKSGLEISLKNVYIALNNINDSLRFIFFASERLSLESKNGKYCVKSRKKEVKPGALSVGERNAISLAYFFASMHEECREAEMYKKDRLVIIDDPIASFDVENRVGMLSFLHWQTEQIIKGNESSKILFLSHDIQTIFDLGKFAKNINGKKSIAPNQKIDHAIWILEKAQLTSATNNRECITINEYQGYINNIFDFATQQNPSTLPQKDNIGNQMRKVAESIATFLYGFGIEELFRDEKLLLNIDESKKTHYRNTLFRLICHGMSHTQEKIRSNNPVFEVFAPEEVQRIAKSFLLFLKDTHELHLFCMLDNTKMQVIKNWEQEIFPSS